MRPLRDVNRTKGSGFRRRVPLRLRTVFDSQLYRNLGRVMMGQRQVRGCALMEANLPNNAADAVIRQGITRAHVTIRQK